MTAERPLPPVPTPAERCAYGDSSTSAGWRWYATTSTWERVCDRHRPSRAGVYVPDEAIVWRQG